MRSEVQQRGQKGQFILTSSAISVQKDILDNEDGRIATIRMRPLSLYESQDSSGEVSLESLFTGDFSTVAISEIDLASLINFCVRGGWPASLGLDYEKYSLFPQEYLNSLINQDIHELEGVKRNSHKMTLLLRSLARNESTTASIASLRRDILEHENELIDEETLATYLALFERLFLVDNQPAFSMNIKSAARIKQAAKRHFVDPSLAIALLGLNSVDLFNDLQSFGFIFEALCVRDLRIYAESFGGQVYHYRDYKNREVDAIVQLADGNWAALQITLGTHAVDTAAKSLLVLKTGLENEGANTPDALAVICGLSQYAYQRKDGVYVIPITALGP